LVGGSTRMPQVTKVLVEKYGIEPKILEPDEAVAKGAAIHAVNVYINKQKNLFEWGEDESGNVIPEPIREDMKDNVMSESLAVGSNMRGIGGKTRSIVVATTKSYAIRLIVEDKPQCHNMIFKNDPMPDGAVTVTQIVGTLDPNQDTVEIIVYENDFMEEYFDVDDDYKMGAATLELPGNLPAGAPIEVTLSLNSEGILEVNGKDITSNKEVHATMQSKFMMPCELVEKLKEKSKEITVM